MPIERAPASSWRAWPKTPALDATQRRRVLVDPSWELHERYPLRRIVVATLWKNRKLKRSTQAEREAYGRMWRCWKNLREAFCDSNWSVFDHWLERFYSECEGAQVAHLLPLARQGKKRADANRDIARNRTSKHADIDRDAVLRMVGRGDKLQAVAAHFGCSSGHISELLKLEGGALAVRRKYRQEQAARPRRPVKI